MEEMAPEAAIHFLVVCNRFYKWDYYYVKTKEWFSSSAKEAPVSLSAFAEQPLCWNDEQGQVVRPCLVEV